VASGVGGGRPVVADDPVTLSLDELLRRADVVAVVQSLIWAALVLLQLDNLFVVSPVMPSWLAIAWWAVTPVVLLMRFVLTLPRHWPGAPYGQAFLPPGSHASPPGGTR
jgi:hypothetical protein